MNRWIHRCTIFDRSGGDPFPRWGCRSICCQKLSGFRRLEAQDSSGRRCSLGIDPASSSQMSCQCWSRYICGLWKLNTLLAQLCGLLWSSIQIICMKKQNVRNYILILLPFISLFDSYLAKYILKIFKIHLYN